MELMQDEVGLVIAEANVHWESSVSNNKGSIISLRICNCFCGFLDASIVIEPSCAHRPTRASVIIPTFLYRKITKSVKNESGPTP